MRLSIITPSLNQLAWLKLCVASVADQALVVEHIVQDAGSTDGTAEWLSNVPHVRLHAESDEGMYDAINRGLRRAGGEVLAYLNCDEQYLPGTLHRVADFFAAHPDIDILFGNAIFVDELGQYLFHRKVEPPGLCHTWTCHLSTLSCGMFFRRALIHPGGHYFNPEYRCGGDGEWMVRLLRAGVRMAALGEFTSVFTLTGTNLSRGERAREEWRKLRATAPAWMRAGAPLWVLLHRLRRWKEGAYAQAPFEFSLYTLASPALRVDRHVSAPMFRLPN